MDAKFIIKIQTCTLTRSDLSQFVVDYDIPQDVMVILPKRHQAIFDVPNGFVGLYTHLFTQSNLRNQFLNIRRRAHCRGPYGLLEFGSAGNWLTLSNRGEADVRKAILKPFTHIQGWKGNLFYIDDKMVHAEYPKLLLDDNKFDKKSFKDVIPYHVQENPFSREPVIYYRGKEMTFRNFMIDGIDGEFSFVPKEPVGNEGTSSRSFLINIETPATYVEPLNSANPSQYVKNIADSEDSPSDKDDVVLIDSSVADILKNQKVSVSPKVPGKRKQAASTPSSRDTSTQKSMVYSYRSCLYHVLIYCRHTKLVNCAEFPEAKELKDSADCHWVVSHVTPPWRLHLKELSLENLCDIHEKAYIRHVVLDMS
ncbi:hypothetical protein Tco_1016745 [Tanacetum coccineum]|uniref:Uncharacterized protein n=1 Tax=Tanacetum coccineum TaxID=301880 RepID=A0ABQ5FQR4_9ASTR